MHTTHYGVLYAARRFAECRYPSTPLGNSLFDEDQQTLKAARARGYKFNAHGECISHTPEQCAVIVAADEIWASMRAQGVPDKPYTWVVHRL